jgi:hypothetical protein
MSGSKKGRKLAHHNEEDVRRALAAVALHSGNTRRAAAALRRQGLTVAVSTLRGWVAKKEDTYAEVRAEVINKVHAIVAEKHRSLAEAEMEVAREFLERMRAEKDQIPPRDLSTALRNLDVGAGIHRDKSLALADRLPGANAVVRNFNDILAALQAKNIRLEVEITEEEPEKPAIEGSAEEVEEES